MHPDEQGLNVYIRDIGQIPLLTPKQEIELAKRIQKKDRKARHQMIMANLRLVVKIAHDYARIGLPLLDLVSEGNIGLSKAVDRFDPSRGVKFNTYAAWWIKSSIRRALTNQSKTIRLPAYLVMRIGRMRKAQAKLTQKLGCEPSDRELATEMGVDSTTVAEWRSLSRGVVSLDAPMDRDEAAPTLGDTVCDQTTRTPFDEINENQMKKELVRLLQFLQERERKIVIRRYGLEGVERETLDAVSRDFNITRERVRQIQNVAVGKLRAMIEERDRPCVPMQMEA